METTEIELAIGGMSCHHCVMTITTGLKELDGVAHAAVDLEAKKATVRPDGTVDQAALRDAIKATVEELGYQVVG
jgi:copper chaperone CopZ